MLPAPGHGRQPGCFRNLNTRCKLGLTHFDEVNLFMLGFFRFSAVVLTLALSACASRHAHDTGAGEGASANQSGVEFYGDVDVGVGNERIR